METLVRALLTAAPPATDDLAMWRIATDGARSAFATTIDRALVGGAQADRLGFAFASGYAEALRALVPDTSSPGQRTDGADACARTVMALCATEEGGAHPRAIKTALTRRAGGGYELTGTKKWATGASAAGALLVVASIGTTENAAANASAGHAGATGRDETGRNQLRVVRISTSAPGVRITPTSAPFVPEIPHAEVELDHVQVADADILPGDGYTAYLKPFRTVEDVHVHAALAGYLVGVARRHEWHDLVERLLAVALATRALAAADPTLVTTHVALAGVLALAMHEVEGLETRWRAQVDDPEHVRWQRDRPLLQVASAARHARRDRAWQQLG